MGGRLEGQITDLFPQLLGTGLALTCWPVTPSSGTPCTPPYPVKILSPSCDTASTPPSVHTTKQRLREFCQHLGGSWPAVSGKLTRKSKRSGVELGRAVRCQAGNGLTNGCWEVATCQRGAVLLCVIRTRPRTQPHR